MGFTQARRPEGQIFVDKGSYKNLQMRQIPGPTQSTLGRVSSPHRAVARAQVFHFEPVDGYELQQHSQAQPAVR